MPYCEIPANRQCIMTSGLPAVRIPCNCCPYWSLLSSYI